MQDFGILEDFGKNHRSFQISLPFLKNEVATKIVQNGALSQSGPKYV